jgi:GTPase SAR1 family protein
MPRKIVHICGASGVGKSTLVQALIENAVPRLRERFGVEDGSQAYGDHPSARSLTDLFFAAEPTIVHDWQYITHGWISRLARAYPDAERRIFLLWRPWSRTRQALKGRGSVDTKDAVIRAWRAIASRFRQLESWGLNVEVVDASTELHDLTAFEAIENAPL